MRSIINYFRSCFCKHDCELIMKTQYYDDDVNSDVPYRATKVYRCKKCGYSKKYKS